MAENLTSDETQLLKEAFAYFDKDGSGDISTAEVRDVMKSLGMVQNEGEIQDIINELEQDQNANIYYSDFASLLSKKTSDEEVKKELKDGFKVFDKSGSNEIARGDMIKILRVLSNKLTDQDIEQIANLADKDKDGNISVDEFIKMLTQK